MADAPLGLSEVLIAEYHAQGLKPSFPADELESWRKKHARLTDARQLDAALLREFYGWLRRNQVRRSALCFSGGGIRSATFGLGLVQALARRRLLRRFDFLSTVSGGGYLGGWLSSWIYHARKKHSGDPSGGVEQVEDELHRRRGPSPNPEPEPIRHLRDYSRYMSPKLGFLSADTWTLAAIFVRNLVLNWLVFLPLLAAVLMVPRISLWLVRLGSAEHPWLVANRADLISLFYWLAVILGWVGVGYNAPNWPSLAKWSRWPERLKGRPGFALTCLLPLLLSAVAITVHLAWVGADGWPDRLPLVRPLPWIPWDNVPDFWSRHPLWAFAIFGMLLNLGGLVYSLIWAPRKGWSRRLRFQELCAVAVSGIAGGLLALGGIWWLFEDAMKEPRTAALYACFSTPLLLLIFFLATVTFAAYARDYTASEDREWMARLGGWLLIMICVRAAFSAIVLFGPWLLLEAKAEVASIGGLSGLVTLYLGHRARGELSETDGARSPVRTLSEKIALGTAAPVFMASVLALLSLIAGRLIAVMTRQQNHLGDPLRVAFDTPYWALALLLVLLVMVGVHFGYLVDVNRFSLHGAYRDRLVRAYLGASRGDARKPHRFTGFDPEDNVELRQLRGNRPFHVLNMALNLVHGKELAWQDRKADSFTVSALHAGTRHLGYRDVEKYGYDSRRDRAMSLGTAVAISGAAASPNMGHHSSPVVTFLLALFNVRLGWWLGNPGPAGRQTWETNGPRFAARPLFAEAFGFTGEDNSYVYLSDGGHFENLGLYEMVLRRCHFIVLSDAGADPDFTFTDLGNAVSRIRIDLGVPIRFKKIPMRPRAEWDGGYDVVRGEDSSSCYALGRICYSETDGDGSEDGWLLYVKPALDGTEPIDVEHYARLNPRFPHEPTSDQLYGEKQFESYRALGEHTMDRILDELAEDDEDDGLDGVFKKARGEHGEWGFDGSDQEQPCS